MVVNTIAYIQHAHTPVLQLPSTWAKKVDYYNLGVQVLPMHEISVRKFALLFNEVCLVLNKKPQLITDNGRKMSAFNICWINLPHKY